MLFATNTTTAAEKPGDPRDPDALEALAEEIVTLAVHLHAGTHRFLTLIARFDRLRGWEPAGHRSCAHWLAFRTGLDPGTAREHVRVARALGRLPRTSAAMARGTLSFSQVRALTRAARPETEADLLELAEGCTTAQLERVVRAWKRGSRGDEAARERARHASRRLSVFPDEEGMYLIRGRLDPEAGAALMRALEAAEDALYRRERRTAAGRDEGPGETFGEEPAEREAARRRADAVGLVVERALAAGFGTEAEPAEGAAAAVPVSGARAERTQVVLHVEPATLAEEGEPGRSELEDGTRVSAETSRRLACDTGVVRITVAGDGDILDVGRRSRTVPPALRRALEARDRGCRFPGCGLRFTEAHHLVHWADGGETSLRNMALLCRRHHRLVHEDGWKAEWWGKERLVFRDPRGGVHMDGAWKAPERGTGDPVGALVRENRRRGVKPDPDAVGARWRREDEIPQETLLRAIEAIL